MTHSSAFAALTALFVLTAPYPAISAQSDVPDKGIATVNGKTIPKSRADAMVAIQVAQGQPDSEQLRKAARDELVNRELIEQEAQNAGFSKRSDIRGQMELARQSALINAFMQDYVRSHPISDTTLKQEYDMLKARLGDREYKARHILLASENAAKDIIARLEKGANFNDLAKESTDQGSRDRAGDLGWAPPSNYVKPFAEAMTALAKGSYTKTPVKTDFGYHVILLEDSRPLNAPSFDATKPQLLKRLQMQLVVKHVSELRSKAKID